MPSLAASARTLACALLACCRATPPPAPVADPPAVVGPPAGTVGFGIADCRLAAPKKSQDACSSDADCGPAAPCHAEECVARARSHPPTRDVLCTEILMCHTADTNRCGCFEGRCALIPGLR